MLCVAAALLSFALVCLPAQATPLNLTVGTPDIMADFIAVNYVAGAAGNNFTASGWAETLDFDGIAPPDYNIGEPQGYDIVAHVTTAGVATGGTLTITGTVNSGSPNGSNDPLSSDLGSPLLTGTLTAMGYPVSGSGELEFLFTVTGGAAAPLFGSQVGVKLNESGYVGLWTADFSNSGEGVTDNFAVPEPMTIAMLLLGLPAILRKPKTRV
jgi:hypothetical protein